MWIKTDVQKGMSIYDKIRGRYDGQSDQPKLTAKQFLGKEVGVAVYSNPGEYLAYLKGLRQPEVEDLEKFFMAVREGLRMENHLQRRKDRVGRIYAFPRFMQPKAGSGYKVITDAGMEKFIVDYADGIIEIDFTLVELAEEAMNP
ncbi:MAG: hypothetical protein ACTHJ8_20275 [Mucilaginibacter sp.]